MSNQEPNAWPADWLSAELRAINSAWMRGSTESFWRGGDSWPNHQPELFLEELAEAQSFGVTPVLAGTNEFLTLVWTGERFNWAVSLDGSLKASPSVVRTDGGPRRVSHAILSSDGGAVLAAGEGRFPKYLSNTTGHYKNEDFVLGPVRVALKRIGLEFER